MDPDPSPDPALFVSGSLLFEVAFTSFFKHKKVRKEVTKQLLDDGRIRSRIRISD
jgi:hypothetical protein